MLPASQADGEGMASLTLRFRDVSEKLKTTHLLSRQWGEPYHILLLFQNPPQIAGIFPG